MDARAGCLVSDGDMTRDPRRWVQVYENLHERIASGALPVCTMVNIGLIGG